MNKGETLSDPAHGPWAAAWRVRGGRKGCKSGLSPPGSRHVVRSGGSFATVGEGSGVGRRWGGLGGQGYGWEDATAQAPDRRNHRAKI